MTKIYKYLTIILLSILISQAIHIQCVKADLKKNFVVYVPDELLINVYITDIRPVIHNYEGIKTDVWCERESSYIGIYTHNILIVEPISPKQSWLIPGNVSAKITDCTVLKEAK